MTATPVMRWDFATGSFVVDDERAAAVIASQGTVTPTAALERSRAIEIDQLRRWGVAYQDAVLVTSERDLLPTPAIQYADRFLLGRGVSASSGDGEQREPGARKKTMMVLAGPMGVGKTVAASYVVANGRPKRLTGPWTSLECPRMLHVEAILTASQLPAGGEADTKTRRELARAQILVIDDLGLERDPKRKMGTYLENLINVRYGGDGWLVLTTNLPPDDFKRRYGERIYDRLRQRAEWFEIAHGSLRGEP